MWAQSDKDILIVFKTMPTHIVKVINREHSKVEVIFQSVYILLVPMAEMLIILKDTQADIQYVHTPTHSPLAAG